MVKRVLIGAAVAVLLVLLGRELYFRLASDEDKILKVIRDTAEAFNDEDNAGVLEGLTPEWQDDTRGLDRNRLQRALSYAFLNRGFRVDGKFAFRGHVDAESYEVEVQEDRADVRIDFIFERLKGADWEEVWSLELTLEMEKRDGRWLIHRSSFRNLSGRSPF